MTITTLPPELLLKIFSSLCYRDLASARRTCRQWRDLSMDQGLLRTIKKRDFSVDKWEIRTYCPSADEIGLAMFLGRSNVIELKRRNNLTILIDI